MRRRHPDMRNVHRTAGDLYGSGMLESVVPYPETRSRLKRLDTWVWCCHCGHLMQVRDLSVSGFGSVYCPFRGCNGSGLGHDLWELDGDQVKCGKYEPLEVGRVTW